MEYYRSRLVRAEREAYAAMLRGYQTLERVIRVPALPGRRLIFSTPPAQVLDEAALTAVDAGAELIDLASPPYGFDVERAKALGLNAWREPGLPGRYCPLSAARVLYGAVIRWEEAQANG